VIRPDAELHLAFLYVERKELDVDVTLALVDGRRLPLHDPRVFDGRLRHHRDDVVAVSAESDYTRIQMWLFTGLLFLFRVCLLFCILVDYTLRSTYGMSRLSVVCLSSVCNVVVPYAATWPFRQYFALPNSSWARTVCIKILGKNSKGF